MTAAVRPTPGLVRWSPWSPLAGLVWAGTVLAGLALCLLGWWWGAGEVSLTHQIGPANVAVGGLVLVSGAGIGWLRHGQASVRARQRDLVLGLRAAPRLGATVAAGTDDTGVVAGEGMDRFHGIDCPFSVGRGWPVIERDDAVEAGLVPCGVCRP